MTKSSAKPLKFYSKDPFNKENSETLYGRSVKAAGRNIKEDDDVVAMKKRKEKK